MKKEYLPFIEMIIIANPKQRKTIINMMNNEQLHFICELALNILAGTITIPDKLKARLMPHKSFLRKLANRKISNRLKKYFYFGMLEYYN